MSSISLKSITSTRGLQNRKKKQEFIPPPLNSMTDVLDIIETELIDSCSKILYETYIRAKIKPYSVKHYSQIMQHCLQI